MSFTGGGGLNVIDADSSAIGGGTNNAISAGSDLSFIGGGDTNIINGAAGGVIGGGTNNTLSGAYSSILGGTGNDDGGLANAHIVGSGIVLGAGVGNPNSLHVNGLWANGVPVYVAGPGYNVGTVFVLPTGTPPPAGASGQLWIM